ncbi:MAG TPA: hypothetical protein VFF30_04290 [Nitrososphaerales archaeon]|nr:hypothetical protein [Nitrososphaerales archaeon]
MQSHTSKPPCYHAFKNHLSASGFTVFPFEFECLGSDHPYVDIAAKMGSMYWAFEYKSLSDSITRGIEQLRCYAEWFDYVVLVSEKEIDHRRSQNYWELKNLGAGLWNYDPIKGRFLEKTNPELQRPNRSNRTFVSRRFRSYTRRQKEEIELDLLTGKQSSLLEYFDETNSSLQL